MREKRKRWDHTTNTHTHRPDVDAFLRDVLEVCERHGMSISHEDGQGGFIVEAREASLEDWLFGAAIGETAPHPPVTLPTKIEITQPERIGPPLTEEQRELIARGECCCTEGEGLVDFDCPKHGR